VKLKKLIKTIALILSLILCIETIPLEALAKTRASNQPQNTLNLLQNTSKTPSNYSKSALNLLENEPEITVFVVIIHLCDNKLYAYDYLFYTVGDFMNEDNFTYATSGWKDKLKLQQQGHHL
jgi:hypothetical protein